MIIQRGTILIVMKFMPKKVIFFSRTQGPRGPGPLGPRTLLVGTRGWGI